MSLYLNKNGETYTEDELIGYAEEEGLSLEEYMETKTFSIIEFIAPNLVCIIGGGNEFGGTLGNCIDAISARSVNSKINSSLEIIGLK